MMYSSSTSTNVSTSFTTTACLTSSSLSSPSTVCVRNFLLLKPAFHGACFGAVSAPTLSARVPRRARAAFEKERFHYEHR